MAKGRRTRIIGDLSKATADKWAKDRGKKVAGGKLRHYEVEPDPENEGRYQLIFVEDELHG